MYISISLLISIIFLVIISLYRQNYKNLYENKNKENNTLYSHIDYFKSALFQLHKVDYEYVEDRKYLFGDVYYICTDIERIYMYEYIAIVYYFKSVEGDIEKRIHREIASKF